MRIIINPVVKRQPYMNVSTCSLSDGSKRVRLHVYRIFEGMFDPVTKMYQKIRRGDHYGKIFPSHEAAIEFAADRGYLTEFYPR